MATRKVTPKRRRAAPFPSDLEHRIEAQRTVLFNVESILDLAVEQMSGKPIEEWPAVRGARDMVHGVLNALDSAVLLQPEGEGGGS